jgi:hypothetical protein
VPLSSKGGNIRNTAKLVGGWDKFKRTKRRIHNSTEPREQLFVLQVMLTVVSTAELLKINYISN